MSTSIAPRVLRLIFDRRRGAILFVIVTSSACLVVDLFLIASVITGKYLAGAHDEVVDVSSMSILAFLILAPLFENICLIGILEFLKTCEMRDTHSVVVISGISAILHGMAGGWRAIPGATGFAMMAYSYQVWNGEPFWKRYTITVAQHCLLNTPSALLLSYLR